MSALRRLNTAVVTAYLGRQKPDRRLELAAPFVGRLVEVVYGRWEPTSKSVGLCLSIAVPTTATADVVVVAVRGRRDRAISLAEVRTIRTIEHEEA